MPLKKNEPYDTYTLILFQTSGAAYLVGYNADDNKKDNAVWLPKSRVVLGEKTGTVEGWAVHEFDIPDWLAEKKELV
jgi:hypothetical protein